MSAPDAGKWELPEVTQDEHGDFYFTVGHVSPALFAMVAILDTAMTEGAAEGMDLLTGGRYSEFVGDGGAGHGYLGRTRHTVEGMAEFLGRIRQTWYRPCTDGCGNDEHMEECRAEDAGALAYTMVRL